MFKEIAVFAGICVVIAGSFFVLGMKIYEPSSPFYTPKENFLIKVEVVNPWGGPVGKYGMEGEIVGHLYVAKRERSDHPYHVYFIHKGDTCKYGGDLAWESVARAVKGKGPMLTLKIEANKDE